MSDNTGSKSSREDFADQLKEAVRKRKGEKELIPPAGIRRGERWETLSEDMEDEFLALAVDKEKAEEYQRTSPPKKQKTQTSILKDWIEKERNLVLASLLMGGVAVLLVGVLTILVYRQNHEIEQLAKQLRTLSGQQPVATQPADFAALSMEVEQLQGRIQGLESQVSNSGISGAANANKMDQKIIDELKEQVSAYGNRLVALEKRVTRLKNLPGQRTVPVGEKVQLAKKPLIEKPASVGPWYINLASLTSRDAAEKLLAAYRQKGVNAKLQEVAVKDKHWYRLRMGPFSNQNDADRNAERIKRLLQVKEVWVTH